MIISLFCENLPDMELSENQSEYETSDTTLDRISKAIQGVRKDIDLSHSVDEFVYANDFEEDVYKLIEVTNDIADHVLNNGEFYMIGEPSDTLTFCTPGRTFQTREIERSNCMAISDMEHPAQCSSDEPGRRILQVHSLTYKSIDLSEKTLLTSNNFKRLEDRGVNLFEDIPTFNESSLTLLDFIHSIPLSVEQTKEKLKLYPIFELNNQLYMLNEASRKELLRLLCDFVDDFTSEGTLSPIKRRDIVCAGFFEDIGRKYSLTVVDSLSDWIFHVFFEYDQDSTSYLPNAFAFSRELSVMILKEKASQNFVTMAEFDRELSARLPAAIKFNEDCLKGISFIKIAPGGEKRLKYFNHSDLPLDLDERLSILFSMSPQWFVSDIEPYIVDFMDPKDTVLKLVSNRCRMSLLNGREVLHPL